MGNPMNGDIYEGQLRPGDVGRELKQRDLQSAMAELQGKFRKQPAQAADEGGMSREMPRYKCHKEVWALKIAKIEPIYDKRPTIAELERILDSNAEGPVLEAAGRLIGGFMVTPADEGYAPFEVGFDYVNRHKPEAGGYFVVYTDGYKSYSPAKAFEEGYTRI